MKLSEHTLSILKNFSGINSGLVLEKGNRQRTISPDKAILVEAELEEKIPLKFGIYDLNQFLGNITTLSSPELSFKDKSVFMEDGVLSLTYYACSPELIISPLDKELVLNKPEVKFDLPNASLAKVLKLAVMNSLSNLSVVGKNGEIMLQAHERNNDTSNSVVSKVADYDGKDFIATFKVDNLKLIPEDYSVEVKLDMFAKFTSKSKKLVYFVALETNLK